MNELLYRIAITKIPNVGAVTAKNLISYCGSAKSVFEAKRKELLRIPGIGEQTANAILDNSAVLTIAEKELVFIAKYAVNVLFYLDEAYPSRLKRHHDCPLILYYKGTQNLNDMRMVGIVGTRKPTTHGVRICEDLVGGLKPYNICIISGLAYGVDITTHKKCLDLNIPTIGIMGSGLGNIYPTPHKDIAERMTLNGGLLTEYTHYQGPDRDHFPSRNRIIAALCDALVVVETAVKGGSMITADKATEYNKDIFAVPGRPKDNLSSGCNWLIKNNRAMLIESAVDIAQAMSWDRLSSNQPVQKQLFMELSPEEEHVVKLLSGKEAMSIDTLSYQAKMNASALASAILSLELKGLIKGLPGKQYILTL